MLGFQHNYCAGLQKHGNYYSKEMATYIATTRQRDKEIAITKLVLGVTHVHNSPPSHTVLFEALLIMIESFH